MKEVTLYTKDFCPFCHKAIALLEKKGVKFTNIDVTHDEETFQKVMKKTGWDSVPQIFIEDEFIGGCDDMHLLDKNEELNKKLGI
ncbi:glutaredoxin 3 [Alkaliphilus hydrothermalis]|uniref:Glutaredoxin n=1 Tax=Alkaliphilus hydrothermalis TaxID=1482730 RepID=A0ABS2NTL5_9FIRM|nr:glutaredoxin 3 [Alkaliphilus hydrothermalis]MBM7616298.1 glutaredoxin 3 [Alkaliphilus hydrothermalis]